jgi:hypothetical protein
MPRKTRTTDLFLKKKKKKQPASEEKEKNTITIQGEKEKLETNKDGDWRNNGKQVKK